METATNGWMDGVHTLQYCIRTDRLLSRALNMDPAHLSILGLRSPEAVHFFLTIIISHSALVTDLGDPENSRHEAESALIVRILVSRWFYNLNQPEDI